MAASGERRRSGVNNGDKQNNVTMASFIVSGRIRQWLANGGHRVMANGGIAKFRRGEIFNNGVDNQTMALLRRMK